METRISLSPLYCTGMVNKSVECIDMGSSSKKDLSGCAKVDLSLSKYNKLSGTCEVTNKIDIDKYFKNLKREYAEQNQKSPRRVLRKSVSSSKIEVSSSSYSTGRPRKSSHEKQKRKSIGDIVVDDPDKSGISSPRQTAGYFNYDISEGKIMEGLRKDDIDCFVSRQKSWDLSLSKKRTDVFASDDDDKEMDLTASYSAGDFKDFVNNNQMVHAKSVDSLSSLGKRHKEHAMNHGRIYSVSEQNRRLRRKYFEKDRKNSDEKTRRLSHGDKRIMINETSEGNLGTMVQNLHLHENQ